MFTGNTSSEDKLHIFYCYALVNYSGTDDLTSNILQTVPIVIVGDGRQCKQSN